MRLAFVISSLNMGGAERVLSLLANGLVGRGHEIVIFTFSPENSAPYYAIDPAVLVKNLNLKESARTPAHAIVSNFRRIATLRRAIRRYRPDAVLPLMDATNILTILACAGLSLPVLCAEHIDPAQHSIGRLWNTLRAITYPFATRILLLTSGIESYFSPLIRRRCAVMPNPVVLDCSGETSYAMQSPAIMGLGRLSHQKGFDILIRAFARVKTTHPTATLWLFGEGEKRTELEHLVEELALADSVFLPGNVPNPGAYLKRADIFALSSRYEGFPIALCEALACGKATVATKFSAGYSDILHDGVNALVIDKDDENALYHALITLLNDNDLRKTLTHNATQILDTYGLEAILDKWERLLIESTQTSET